MITTSMITQAAMPIARSTSVRSIVIAAPLQAILTLTHTHHQAHHLHRVLLDLRAATSVLPVPPVPGEPRHPERDEGVEPTPFDLLVGGVSEAHVASQPPQLPVPRLPVQVDGVGAATPR